LPGQEALECAVAVGLLHLLEGGDTERAIAAPAQGGLPQHGLGLGDGERHRGGLRHRSRAGRALHMALDMVFGLACLTFRH